MLWKIKKIQNIGKFYNAGSVDQNFDFDKTTVIYAKNGRGKTTFTQIIRSLKENNPELINGRKTLGQDNELSIELKFKDADGNNKRDIVFANMQWITSEPNIHIFDHTFVEENLFTDTVTPDHQKQLTTIVMGEEGVALAEELKSLKEKETEASKEKELKEKTKALFEKTYPETINKILDDLEADFKIKQLNMKTKGISTEKYTSFVLEVKGHSISIEGKENAPHFKNTLSAGDKNCLAFAFFLAHLESKVISNSIIVFDDPLSSLDMHRRQATFKKLKELNSRAEQLICLSHHKDLINLYWQGEKFTKTVQDIKFYQIHDYKGCKGSQIDQLEPEEMFLDKYHKKLRKLHKYTAEDDGSSSEIIQGDIRIVLEDYLRRKYFIILGKSTSTLNHIVNQLKGKKIEAKIADEILELGRICSLPHHASQLYNAQEILDYDNLLPYVKRCLELVEGKDI